MGYTNYWKRPTELSSERFRLAVIDCRRVLPLLGVELGGPDGSGQPVLDDDHIAFNGRAPRICEPFEVAQTEFDRRGRLRFFCSCKTEQHPYDLCVQVALIILSHHLDTELQVTSDGAEDAWDRARGLVNQHLGYGNGFKLQREDSGVG